VRYIDVFNGDGDGICALHQLRLADPVDSGLVTGMKRDIALLDRVQAAAGDVVTVLDISLDRNRASLEKLLAAGVVVRYFDHHYAGHIPEHPNLDVAIHMGPATCTSALVDRHVGGRFRAWAVVGAFGDGLEKVALDLAQPLEMGTEKVDALRELGAALNYNACGESEDDGMVTPIELYRLVHRYLDPFDLLAAEPLMARISQARHADLQRAMALAPYRSRPLFDAYLLPDAAWSRRVGATFANVLARQDPARAHAVLSPARRGGFVVSVRTPPGRGVSAVELCRRFPTGGGRESAAGIDRLERIEPLLDALGEAVTEP
jgi:hypothetical protein